MRHVPIAAQRDAAYAVNNGASPRRTTRALYYGPQLRVGYTKPTLASRVAKRRAANKVARQSRKDNR